VYELQLFNIPTYQTSYYDTICDGEAFFWRNNYYTSQGIYYDSLYTSQGCDSVFVLNLSVNPVFLHTDSVVICNGESFFWQGNIYNTQGIYYDTLLTQFGCDSVYLLKLFVTEIDVSVTENNAILTANTSGAVYQWVDCDDNFASISGAISEEFIPAINGNYAVIITQNNCTDTSACYLVDDVFINEIYQTLDIEIYPNPNNGMLFIKTNHPIWLIFYNVIGDVLSENYYTQGLHAIDLKHLANGVYFLNAVGKNNFVNRKIIIQK